MSNGWINLFDFHCGNVTETIASFRLCLYRHQGGTWIIGASSSSPIYYLHFILHSGTNDIYMLVPLCCKWLKSVAILQIFRTFNRHLHTHACTYAHTHTDMLTLMYTHRARVTVKCFMLYSLCSSMFVCVSLGNARSMCLLQKKRVFLFCANKSNKAQLWME